MLSAASVGGVLVYTLDRQMTRVSAQQMSSAQAIRVPLRFFTQAEALTVAAATARIFPSDESGPGANEAGVVIFIDRQLAGPRGRDARRYTQGPFEETGAPPEVGYQGKATLSEIYREGLKTLDGFDQLSPAEQDQKLKEIEDTHFFSVLRKNTIEGMFSDPLHGGNIDMVGWQLIGFPGPQMSWAAEVNKHSGEAFRPQPMSLRDVLPGHKFHSSEDQDQKG
ncbi:MAG: gluconate 2-dehydrogenase subunit 3 family protein [Candidatus Acidiferrales bacterium]